ncbi:MFS transporter [Streptomyces sp. NPDC088354]|uniref:MFS transporter n=1 Tax=Streptomyces sp. NPDC088354 TaxID=3365856 RepID=UPI0038065FEC
MSVPMFRRHFTARVLSWTGTAVSPVALAFAVLGMGGGVSGLSVVLAADMAARAALLLVGGVAADRWSRTAVLIVANTAAASGQCCAAVLVWTGAAQVWHLAMLAVLGGVAGAFIGPASGGVLRTVVPPEQLRQANALMRLAQNSVKVGGPALGGVIVAAVGPQWAIAWDAATYLVAALIYTGLHMPKPPGPSKRANRVGLGEGWREIAIRPWLWLMLAQGLVVVPIWLVSYQALGPAYGHERLGGAAGWGLAMTGFTAGLLVGAALALWWHVRRVGWLFCWGTALMATPMLAMACGSGLVLVVPGYLMAGAGEALTATLWTVLLQRRIRDEVFGRVMAFSNLAQLAPVPLASLAVGPIAHESGVRTALAGCGLIVLGAAAAPLAHRRVRALSLPPRPETVARREPQPQP